MECRGERDERTGESSKDAACDKALSGKGLSSEDEVASVVTFWVDWNTTSATIFSSEENARCVGEGLFLSTKRRVGDLVGLVSTERSGLGFLNRDGMVSPTGVVDSAKPKTFATVVVEPLD